MLVFSGEQASGRAAAGVLEVIASGTTSRCMDDLAALVLDCPLPIEPAPVRLEPTTHLGEELLRSGFAADATGAMQRRETPTHVLEVAPEAGSVAAPPRSLRLAGGLCDVASGSANLSPETGAVVAISAQRRRSSCADPQDETIAMQLAAFESFLLDAAERAGTALVLEARAEAGPGGDDACAVRRLRDIDAGSSRCMPP
jgi:hypothetical protein